MGIKILFWSFLFIVFYTYLGYGILLWLINRAAFFFRKGKMPGLAAFEPSVALVIAAFNEEDCIEEKIKNTLSLDYPEHKLAIYFITDGSTDNGPLIIGRYPRITLLHQPERYGKAAAMNRAMQFIKEPYVIFSDANTVLNKDCIKEILKFYADQADKYQGCLCRGGALLEIRIIFKAAGFGFLYSSRRGGGTILCAD